MSTKVREAETDREVWIEREGARLFARVEGQGPPIVFLHGGLADHRASWMRVGSLAARYRVIAPDLRGSGRSIDRGALSWDQLADDVRVLLRELGITRAVVGGTSAGSAVALRFALRHPEHTRALVLAAPVFRGATRGLDEAQRAAFAAMDSHATRAVREGVEAMRPLYRGLPPDIRERAFELVRGFDPASLAATTRFLASGAQPFERLEELAVIEAPTLVIRGSDPEHPADLADEYARHLPRCVIEGAESELAARVGAFCASLPPG